MIYILENIEKFYKIGYSKHPEKRVKQLNTGNSTCLTLLKTYTTRHDSKIESFLKSYFKLQQIRGEWFDLSKEDLEKIDEMILSRDKALDIYDIIENNKSELLEYL